MVRQSVNVSEMLNQSIEVITNPSVSTFEKYETRGTMANAAVYVGIAAAISGVLGLITGLLTPGGSAIGGLIGSVLSTLVGFFVFTGAVYFIGKAMANGTGNFDEVAYTFSLFSAPLSVIGSVLGVILLVLAFIPIINILAAFAGLLVAIGLVIAQIYFAYTAVQSSMNIRPGGQAWVVLVLAGVASIIINSIITSIF